MAQQKGKSWELTFQELVGQTLVTGFPQGWKRHHRVIKKYVKLALLFSQVL